MFQFLDSVFSRFRQCFSRSATFNWFVVVVIGLMIRMEKLGVTSFIRALTLKETAYDSLIHFFRASSYKLKELMTVWYSIISDSGFLHKVNDRIVLHADGTKTSKEGRFMPACKKLFQESENSAKPSYIYGHMYGGLSAEISKNGKHFDIPLSMEIQDGLASVADWDDSQKHRATSHVVRMIENGYEAASLLGKAYMVMDRYFLTVPALQKLIELNTKNHLVDIVTRAKTNCIAFQDPAPREKPGRGRPAKKGPAVKLMKLFDSEADKFISSTVTMYGKEEAIQYLCLDLLWGQKLYHRLRFVLTKSSKGNSIFVTTDLSLDPKLVIECYASRFRIETMFREMKQQIGCFSYHFWSKAMPKLNRYKKKDEPDALSKVTDSEKRELILSTVKATERFAFFSCIAIGISQMMALNETFAETVSKDRYLRTKTAIGVSEATVLHYLRKHFFRLSILSPDSTITRIIREITREDVASSEPERPS